MARFRSFSVVVVVVGVVLFAAACSSSGSAKAKTDSGSSSTAAASDTGSSGANSGSSTGGGTPPGHAADEAGLKTAATDFADKLISKDPSAAYAYLTAACHAKVTKAQFVTEVKQSLSQVKQVAANGSSLSIGTVSTQDVSATKGKVAFELLGADGQPLTDGESSASTPSYDPWVYQRGEWHPVSCGSSNSGDSGSSDSSSVSATLDS